jgi:HPt (histidine-containing phosphotransfer) domain-containing protein
MVAINTILIIVNSATPQGLTGPRNSHARRLIGATVRRKQGKLAAGTPNVPLTNSVIGWRKRRCRIDKAGEIWITAMPLHLERIDWMPSPPLAPDDGPIDIEHLQRMTLGDVSLEREVLAMFSAQAVGLVGALVTLPADAGALVHTLKGSARAIGAFGVADAAGCLEALIQNGGDPAQALAELNDAVTQARTAIDAMLHRS